LLLLLLLLLLLGGQFGAAQCGLDMLGAVELIVVVVKLLQDGHAANTACEALRMELLADRRDLLVCDGAVAMSADQIRLRLCVCVHEIKRGAIIIIIIVVVVVVWDCVLEKDTSP
jgi:hypothetical protein